MGVIRILIMLAFMLVMAGALAGEFFLARRPGKWPGLIPPIALVALCLLLPLLNQFGAAMVLLCNLLPPLLAVYAAVRFWRGRQQKRPLQKRDMPDLD